MKKFILFVVFCLAMSGFTFAQSKFPELEKVKNIKLLESTREDVKKIFGDDDEFEGEYYSTDLMAIRITYAEEECSDESDEDWNVPKGKVTGIDVRLFNSVDPKDLQVDLSKLERINRNALDEDYEEEEEEDPDNIIYFVKDKSISYSLLDGKIKTIKFIPAEKNYPALCANEDLREFSSAKDWFLDKITDRFYPSEGKPFVNVSELTLNKTEIFADCATGAANDLNSSAYMKITIEAKGESSDPTDVLTYNYTISGGRIIGEGANVTWDLSGVKPGKYTITAGADNGCGVCGTTKTETVVVKEFADCKPKK